VLSHYNDSYKTVSEKVEAALMKVARDPNDPAIEILLRLTQIGLSDSPVRKSRKAAGRKGSRTKVQREADHKFYEQQRADPAVRASRIPLLQDLAVKWYTYVTDLRSWSSVPAKSRTGPRPKRPKLELRHFEINRSEDWDGFLKSKWRAVSKAEAAREEATNNPAPDFDWRNVAPSSVVDIAIIDLQSAFTRWYQYMARSPAEKLRVPEVGAPKLKRKMENESFSLISSSTMIESGRIKLTNIGWINLKERDYLPLGKNKHRLTVSTEGDKWFVSVLAEFEPSTLSSDRPSVGIDVGIVDYAILQPDNGPIERIANPDYREKGKRRQSCLQRRLDRKSGPEIFVVTKPDGTKIRCPSRRSLVAREAVKQGWEITSEWTKPSNRWKKMQAKINRQYYRMKCQHRHFQHEITTAIICRFSSISVETLGIIDMLLRRPKRGLTKSSNRKLRRLMSGASWYEFRRMLQYKAEWYGSYVEAVSRWYPSTQDCSTCGTTTEVNWSDRKCRCPKCGLVIDMDDNAAINLLFEMSRDFGSKTAAD